ncbi:hypothetical protein BD769DRAFT_1734903 [Suillus cothurnatus]|nr:hypothetical protein BD769DRAFT_1734903 [Suillus cothurnatus]
MDIIRLNILFSDGPPARQWALHNFEKFLIITDHPIGFTKDHNHGQILWISSGNEWFYQRGVELGYPCPTMYDNSINTIILASGDVRMATDVYTYTELCQVKTLKGKIFWLTNQCTVPIKWEEVSVTSVLKGGKTVILDAAINSVKKNTVALKGLLATPIGKGHVSLNLTRHWMFNLFVNICPCV